MTIVLIFIAIAGILAAAIGLHSAKKQATELERAKVALKAAQNSLNYHKIHAGIGLSLEHVTNKIRGTMENCSYWRIKVQPKHPAYNELRKMLEQGQNIRIHPQSTIGALLTDSAIITGVNRAIKHPEDMK